MMVGAEEVGSCPAESGGAAASLCQRLKNRTLVTLFNRSDCNYQLYTRPLRINGHFTEQKGFKFDPKSRRGVWPLDPGW